MSNLLPASAQVGTSGLTVRVQGDFFIPESVVRVNGSDRATTYIQPEELEVTLTTADLAAVGAKTLTVFNPGPGGGVSLNNKSFTITALATNPIPSIDILTPGGATAGDPAPQRAGARHWYASVDRKLRSAMTQVP